MANRRRLTAKVRERFLDELRQTANVSAAVAAANLGRRTAYTHRSADVTFREAWDDALEEGADRLETEARRRAVDGWDEPVYQDGREVGKVRCYSDRLLVTLLRAHRPEKYGNAARPAPAASTLVMTFQRPLRDPLGDSDAEAVLDVSALVETPA